LDVTGLAGIGHITFAGTAKLEIGNSAILFGLGFPGVIDFFDKHDVIDLTGLHFHAGAHASYEAAGGVLTSSPLGTRVELSFLLICKPLFPTAAPGRSQKQGFLLLTTSGDFSAKSTASENIGRRENENGGERHRSVHS
jgi:hypothetical protein